MVDKKMWDWMDKAEGKKVGSSYNALGKEMKRQGYGVKNKGWRGESERHRLASYGIKTAIPKIPSYNVPKTPNYEPNVPSGGRLFKLKNGVVVVAWYEKTRNAFRHMAKVYKWDGNNWQQVGNARIPYQNRTWESYEYQSILRKAIDGVDDSVLSPEEKIKAQEYAKDGLEKQEHERVKKEFGSIGAIAQMGEIFGSTQKEKNDWKARMLKAGLGNKGLQMPEDWDSLSEDEKEKRLNKVIAFTRKEII